MTPVPRAGFDPDELAPWELDELGPLSEVRSIRVADVPAERVRWLWTGRLPRGKPVVLDGDPGLGKSTITQDLTARVSTGSPMPDGERLDGPADVVLLSAEDGIADTIRPRLEAAGADCSRVHVFSEVHIGGNGDALSRLPSLPNDVERLEALVNSVGAALVVVDVLNAFLSLKTDAYRDQDVRHALHPLATMAERTGAVVLVLRHLSKTGGANAVYRGGGSVGIIGAARVGLLVAPDPSDETRTRRILAVTKCNLAAEAPALAFRLVPSEEHGCARVQWEGPTTHRANDLLAMPVDDDERGARDEAKAFLADMLDGGRVLVTEVKTQARRAGLADRTLERAKRDLGVRSVREGFGRDGVWFWQLPESHTPPPKPIDAHPKTLDTYADSGALWPEEDHA